VKLLRDVLEILVVGWIAFPVLVLLAWASKTIWIRVDEYLAIRRLRRWLERDPEAVAIVDELRRQRRAG
jgi:hypothetical protein